MNTLTNTSIAVLPFVNMSPDPENEYFSDGITEEIINALTRVKGLKVIARTSCFAYKGKNMDIRAIGKELGVSTVLEGSVRKAKNRFRITSQLINAMDGVHIWSKTYDREMEDIFIIQDEISLRIADQISENFGHLHIQEHLVNVPTKNLTAYDLYLKGRYQQLRWEPDSLKQAIEFYNKAADNDPGFAKAYYGNLQCYGLLAAWGYMPQHEGFGKAIENFNKAKELDTNLPEYYMSFVGKSLWGEWDFKTAYEQLRQTLALNPNYCDGLEAMAELFIANGYFEESKKFVKQALSIDPLSANHHYTFANINYMQGNFETALSFLEKSLALNPQLILAQELKIMCAVMLQDKARFEEFTKERQNKELYNLLFEAVNGKLQNLPDEKVNMFLNSVESKNQLVPYELFILANSGFTKQALQILSQYVEQKRGQIINYRYEPLLKPLREIKEFNDLHISNFKLPTSKNKTNTEQLVEKQDKEKLNFQMKELKLFIEKNNPYLNPQLSLNSLAESINIHANRLSFLINEMTGMNFNEFINKYRLEHFKKIALSEENNHLSIIGLAYESGFNSKTVFNAYFKKSEGITPGAWIKSFQKNN